MRLVSLCTAAFLTFLTPAHALARGPAPEMWVPARWQGGPLEIQRRARDKNLPPEGGQRDALRRWYELATLDLLQGTPINCLLVTWSVGEDPESEREQQQIVSAYARAARARGIAVLGVVHHPAKPAYFLAPAIQADLDGLVLDGIGAADSAEVQRTLRKMGKVTLVLSSPTHEQVGSGSEILVAADGVPARVQELSDDAEATPSSEPWINANGWLAESLRAAGGKRPAWLLHTLDADATGDDYLRAIADTAMGGAQWVIALSDELRHQLKTGDARALSAWRQIAAFLRFSRDHAWPDQAAPRAVCAFIQDSAIDPDASGEHLKLIIRKRIPVSVIERANLRQTTLAGLRAVHAIALTEPTAAERRLLSEFVHAGGVVLVGPAWRGNRTAQDAAFTTGPAGKGRFVFSRDEWPDPEEVALTLIDLIGRDHLGLRLFRGASVLARSSVLTVREQVAVQLVNYASHPAESLLVRVSGAFGKVRLLTPDRNPEELPLDRSEKHVEVTIPRLSIYGVLIFEKGPM